MMKNIRVAIPLLLVLSLLGPALHAEELKAVRVAQGPKMDGLMMDDVWRSAEAFTAFRRRTRVPAATRASRPSSASSTTTRTSTSASCAGTASPARISANTMAHDGRRRRARLWRLRTRLAERERRRHARPARSFPGQAHRLFFLRQSPRRPRRRSGLRRASASLNWDGIWDAGRPHRRRRLERRDADPLQDHLVQARPGRLGHQRRALHRPQAGDDPPLRDEPRQQFLQSHGRRRAWRGSRASSRARASPSGPTAWSASKRTTGKRRRQLEAGRRLRHLQELHAQPGRRRQLQHGFRRDRGRRAAHQPDPLPAVLPGEADVLPGGLGDVQLQLERQLPAVLQPQDRAVPGQPDPGPLRRPRSTARSATPTWPSSTCRPGKLRRDRRPQLPGRRASTQNIFSREQGRPDLDQRQPDRASATPWPASISTTPPPGSWATRTSCSPPGRPTTGTSRTDGSHHGFGFRADYPNDLWNIQSTYAYYGEALDPGLGYHDAPGHPDRSTCAWPSSRGPGAGFLGVFVRQFLFQRQRRLLLGPEGQPGDQPAPARAVRASGPRAASSLSFEITPNRDVLPLRFRGRRRASSCPPGPTISPATRLRLQHGASHRPWRLRRWHRLRANTIPAATSDLSAGLTLQAQRATANLGVRRQPGPRPSARGKFQRERLPAQGRRLPFPRPRA